jgi:hypothetical protein
MDAVNSTILKTTIEAIPVLTEENFSTWKTRITALFKLGGLKDHILTREPALEDNDNSILCAVIIAKLSITTHKNIVNSTNEEDTQLLWKSILKRFISNEPSNHAQVYNSFANITFDTNNIKKFITDVRSTRSLTATRTKVSSPPCSPRKTFNARMVLIIHTPHRTDERTVGSSILRSEKNT